MKKLISLFLFCASNEWQSAITRIFTSSDKGVSWKEISVIQGLFWSNLFVHNNALYNIGTNKHHGKEHHHPN